MDLIISHGHCPDGFTAALIAKKKWPEAKVLFLDHGLTDLVIADIIAKAFMRDVVMFDYSFRRREDNDAMHASANSFHVYDHHKTAEATLAGAPYATFDMKRSGAGLAWDYLFGKHSLGPYGEIYEERPWYVDYVEDRDLWNWKLDRSKEVCAYLGTLKLEFDAWGKLHEIIPRQAADLGTGALAHIDHYVREAVKQVRGATLDGAQIGILNVPYLNCSEVGNAIANSTAFDYSLTWFERQDDFIQFSLRSVGDKDVSEVAKRYGGGGGHRNAAGFQLPYEEGRRLIDQALGRS